jgi:hypothetical protein
MPQSSQIIGANSVTNIELDKGVLPAPIVRNADWLESCLVRIADRALCPPSGVETPRALRANSITGPYLYRIVANGRFTRGRGLLRAN